MKTELQETVKKKEKVKMLLVGDLNDFFLLCSLVTVVMTWYFGENERL